MKRYIIVFLVIFLSGCAESKLGSSLFPGNNLSSIQSYYVLKNEEDDHEIYTLIRDNIKARGLEAEAGFELPPQSSIDAIITYEDRWFWDLSMYLIQLKIQIREAENDFPIATGISMRTSLIRRSPEGMVDEVLTKIFKDDTRKE